MISVSVDESEMVLQGAGGNLFLRNDSNRVIEQIEGRYPVPTSALAKIAAAHRFRQDLGRDLLDFAYHHALIPNKEVILARSLPEEVSFERMGPRPLTAYRAAGMNRLWEPFYEPSLLMGDRPAFPTTDTHWNHDGALRYLEGFLSCEVPVLGAQLRSLEMRRFASEQWGDLGRKIGAAKEQIEIIVPKSPTARLIYENAITNEGSVRVFRQDVPVLKRKALILHDSFGNWMTGFLSELFSQSMFLHGADFDIEFIRQYRPDYVLFFQIERFFVRSPLNDVDYFKYISEQEAKKGTTRPFEEFVRSSPWLFD